MSSRVIEVLTKGGGATGKGCVGQLFLSRNLTLRDRPLFNRKERLAGEPIEDEYKAVLVASATAGNLASLLMHRYEDWLTRGVIVP